MNVKELTHSQQQPQAPKTHKKESTVRLTTRITMLWVPKGLSFTGLRTQLKASARHTLSNQQAQVKQPETVNLIENAQRHFQFCTKMYMGSTRNGIEFGFNSQTVLILLLLLKTVCGLNCCHLTKNCSVSQMLRSFLGFALGLRHES